MGGRLGESVDVTGPGRGFWAGPAGVYLEESGDKGGLDTGDV